jgi:hypothetical protein
MISTNRNSEPLKLLREGQQWKAAQRIISAARRRRLKDPARRCLCGTLNSQAACNGWPDRVRLQDDIFREANADAPTDNHDKRDFLF